MLYIRDSNINTCSKGLILKALPWLLYSNISRTFLLSIIVSKLSFKYRVFTGNCGKVTCYISGSIVHKLPIFLYLCYHGWTYITTNFQCHSRSFDIGKLVTKWNVSISRNMLHGFCPKQRIYKWTPNGGFTSEPQTEDLQLNPKEVHLHLSGVRRTFTIIDIEIFIKMII